MNTVAIIGATGAVGQEILRLLEERHFPVGALRCIASTRSIGKTVLFRGQQIPLETIESLSSADFSFFCAGSAVSREWIPKTSGSIIDSSSAWRMDPTIPLIIPEINSHAIEGRVIASPNCAATVLLMPLAPLHRKYRVKRIVAATYQAASGGGAHLLHQLQEETRAHLSGQSYPHVFSFPYAFNLYPHNSKLDASGYVEEEIKIREESRKILEDASIQVSATCVRVPVLRAHSVAANVEFHHPFSLQEVYATLENAQGVKIFEERAANRFATPVDAANKDDIYCGRFRIDPSRPNTLEFWAVGDQLRKGAALNAVQIAERMLHVAQAQIN